MLPVFWLESADADLAKLTEYIGKRAIHAAERLWQRLRECVLPLSEHPFLYRLSGRVAGLREVVAHPNYIVRSEEHTSELQSLMRSSYAVFCLTKKNMSELPAQ